jgi:hypothetical protein
MFDKSVDKGLVVLSAVENCIEEAVQSGTKRMQHISRVTIWTGNSKSTADPHRIQLNQMSKQMQSQHPEAASA